MLNLIELNLDFIVCCLFLLLVSSSSCKCDLIFNNNNDNNNGLHSYGQQQLQQSYDNGRINIESLARGSGSSSSLSSSLPTSLSTSSWPKKNEPRIWSSKSSDQRILFISPQSFHHYDDNDYDVDYARHIRIKRSDHDDDGGGSESSSNQSESSASTSMDNSNPNPFVSSSLPSFLPPPPLPPMMPMMMFPVSPFSFYPPPLLPPPPPPPAMPAMAPVQPQSSPIISDVSQQPMAVQQPIISNPSPIVNDNQMIPTSVNSAIANNNGDMIVDQFERRRQRYRPKYIHHHSPPTTSHHYNNHLASQSQSYPSYKPSSYGKKGYGDDDDCQYHTLVNGDSEIIMRKLLPIRLVGRTIVRHCIKKQPNINDPRYRVLLKGNQKSSFGSIRFQMIQ